MVRPVMSVPVSGGEPCCYDCKESRENADGCVHQYPGTEERGAGGPAAREACGPPAPGARSRQGEEQRCITSEFVLS
eukprot:1414784-Alexandrium_andersonii.AAC.1